MVFFLEDYEKENYRMKYKTEVKKIVNKLIKKSFPILKNKRIFVCYFKSKDYSGIALWPLPFLRLLFINEDRRFNKEELTGLLAHELCHFETYEKRGWVKTVLLGTRYMISQKFRKNEERMTDNLAIEKGYAKRLYKQRLFRWDSTDKNHKLKEVYMPPKQIKRYAIKNRKW